MTQTINRRTFLKLASVTGTAAFLAACGGATTEAPAEQPAEEPVEQPPSGEAVTLEFWTFNDYAVGTALELFQTFIKEFEEANAGIKVNITGKPGTDILAGLVAGAGSGDLPDSVQIQLGAGGDLLAASALADLKAMEGELASDYFDQFTKSAIDLLRTADGHLWGFPFSAYATILFRNLKVLKDAGIDPAAGVVDWADLKAQVEKVAASGANGIGKVLGNDWIQKHFYGGVTGATKDTISADGKSTTMEADKYATLFEYLLELKPYTIGSFMFDTAATDLFISNQLGFLTMGPWLAPTLEEAVSKSGLEWDAVQIPGQSTADKGSVRGGEFTGVMPTDNREAAFKWAVFVSDWPQAARWAGDLGRFMANDKALQQPAPMANWLVQLTSKSFPEAMNEGPFMKKLPTGWSQPEIDHGSLVDQGTETAEEGAQKLIDEMNAILSEG